MASETYLGNPNLKNVGQKIEWTEETLTEYMKCKDDPEYFIQNFVKIIHVDRGLVPFEMYDYQKDMIHKFNDNRFVICKMPRQTGKSTTIIAFLLHYILFNESVNVAILANKGAVATTPRKVRINEASSINPWMKIPIPRAMPIPA